LIKIKQIFLIISYLAFIGYLFCDLKML